MSGPIGKNLRGRSTKVFLYTIFGKFIGFLGVISRIAVDLRNGVYNL